MTAVPVVNGLWIGSSLSPMERLTIRSFTDAGYSFRLWAYDVIQDLPEGLTLEDANTIIRRDDLFSYRSANIYGHGKGSYAGFSDLFRYKLLYEHGGIWVDMDMTCLGPLSHSDPYRFRTHKQLGAVGNYLECPRGSELMQWCYEESNARMNADNTDWMLPIRILNTGIQKYQLEEYIFKDTNDDEFPKVARMLRRPVDLPSHWKLLHWLNEEFRRIGLSKEVCLKDSVLHRLCVQHDVDIHVLHGREAMKYRWTASRWNYLLLNAKARLEWYLKPLSTNPDEK